jgi:hypothetical protein
MRKNSRLPAMTRLADRSPAAIAAMQVGRLPALGIALLDALSRITLFIE